MTTKSKIAKEISLAFSKKLSVNPLKKKVDLNKTENRLKQYLNQTESRPKVDLSHQKSRPKVDSKLDLQVDLNKTESRPKVDLNKTFSSLTGKELEMVYFIYEECLSNGGTSTNKLSIAYIKSKLKSSEIALKRTLQRVTKKEILKKESIKNGRGGWTIYHLPNDVYSQVLQGKSRPKIDPNYTETRPKLDSKLDRKLDLSPSSSSSSIYNNKEKTTTTDMNENQQNIFQLGQEWFDVDTTPLNEIRFGADQLKQIAKLNIIGPKEVERSIEEFAHDIKNKLIKTRKSPLALFMGILRKGEAYTSVDSNFKTDEELFYEGQARAKMERAEKIKKWQQDAKEAGFTIWKNDTKDSEIDKLLREAEVSDAVIKNQFARDKQIEIYFNEHIWKQQNVGSRELNFRESKEKEVVL